MTFNILNHINHHLYDDNADAQEIWRITQPELNEMDDKAHRVFLNTRTVLADEEGITRDERVFNIRPDKTIDSLEERRERVLERKRERPPFTETWMQAVIAKKFISGEVEAQLSGLYLKLLLNAEAAGLNEYGVTVRRFREIFLWLRSWIPSNVLISTTAVSQREATTATIRINGAGMRVSKRGTNILQPPQLPPTATLRINGTNMRISRRT